MAKERDSQKTKFMFAFDEWCDEQVGGFWRARVPQNEAKYVIEHYLHQEGITAKPMYVTGKRKKRGLYIFRLAVWINIHLPKQAQRRCDILHEVAHAVAQTRTHNPKFCSTLIRLVALTDKHAASRLVSMFIKHRVKTQSALEVS